MRNSIQWSKIKRIVEKEGIQECHEYNKSHEFPRISTTPKRIQTDVEYREIPLK